MSSTRALPEPSRKLFYKIGNVCELTGTQPYILRFWESEFPQLAPQKSRSGQRLFRERDIETVRRIKQLLYEEGYTIAGARKRLEQESVERGAHEGAGDDPQKPPPGTTAAPPADRARVDAPPQRRHARRALKQLRRELEVMLRRLDAR